MGDAYYTAAAFAQEAATAGMSFIVALRTTAAHANMADALKQPTLEQFAARRAEFLNKDFRDVLETMILRAGALVYSDRSGTKTAAALNASVWFQHVRACGFNPRRGLAAVVDVWERTTRHWDRDMLKNATVRVAVPREPELVAFRMLQHAVRDLVWAEPHLGETKLGGQRVPPSPPPPSDTMKAPDAPVRRGAQLDEDTERMKLVMINGLVRSCVHMQGEEPEVSAKIILALTKPLTPHVVRQVPGAIQYEAPVERESEDRSVRENRREQEDRREREGWRVREDRREREGWRERNDRLERGVDDRRDGNNDRIDKKQRQDWRDRNDRRQDQPDRHYSKHNDDLPKVVEVKDDPVAEKKEPEPVVNDELPDPVLADETPTEVVAEEPIEEQAETPELVGETPGLVGETPELDLETPELVVEEPTETPVLAVEEPELNNGETPVLAVEEPEQNDGETPALAAEEPELVAEEPDNGEAPEFVAEEPEHALPEPHVDEGHMLMSELTDAHLSDTETDTDSEPEVHH